MKKRLQVSGDYVIMTFNNMVRQRQTGKLASMSPSKHIRYSGDTARNSLTRKRLPYLDAVSVVVIYMQCGVLVIFLGNSITRLLLRHQHQSLGDEFALKVLIKGCLANRYSDRVFRLISVFHINCHQQKLCSDRFLT